MEISGGTRAAEELKAYSTLAGEREERVVTRDHTGKVVSETTHRVPVFTPAQIAQLPRGRVLLIRRDLAPVIGKIQMAWQRPDVKAIKRANRRTVRADKRNLVWARRRELARRSWAAFKAALLEMAEEIATAAGQWSEQRRQAAWRRQEEQARQVEADRAGHEPIDPQPTAGHEPPADAGRDELGRGESDED